MTTDEETQRIAQGIAEMQVQRAEEDVSECEMYVTSAQASLQRSQERLAHAHVRLSACRSLLPHPAGAAPVAVSA